MAFVHFHFIQIRHTTQKVIYIRVCCPTSNLRKFFTDLNFLHIRQRIPNLLIKHLYFTQIEFTVVFTIPKRIFVCNRFYLRMQSNFRFPFPLKIVVQFRALRITKSPSVDKRHIRVFIVDNQFATFLQIMKKISQPSLLHFTQNRFGLIILSYVNSIRNHTTGIGQHMPQVIQRQRKIFFCTRV